MDWVEISVYLVVFFIDSESNASVLSKSFQMFNKDLEFLSVTAAISSSTEPGDFVCLFLCVYYIP